MALSPGTRLGTYEIVSALGAGGMGEVYRARDTKLNREVALKVLPDAFTRDPDRLARLKREAQVLASLNHPRIGAIYGFEDSGASHALVLELVEGDTLADRIARGPIALDEALPIARQICEALEAAHEHGVIHRDLKPANIKITPDGVVKVLDFGLAKALEPVSGTHIDATASPTITSPALMTGVGVLLGTAAYMSPEQARGKAVDRRSDIWAFGCVLYEMLTGRQAFTGDSISDSIASILTKQPDWAVLPSGIPAPLSRLLRWCLEKNVHERLHDIGDARLDIADAVGLEDKAAVPGVARQLLRGQRALSLVAALLVGAVASRTAVWLASRPAPASPPLTRLSIALAGDQALVVGSLDRDLTVSPDGTRLVYIGANGSQMFVRRLDSLDATPLGELSAPRGLFTSPDGAWVGFFNGVGTLSKIPISGGRRIKLCECGTGPRGGTWGPDGTIIMAGTDPTSGLLRVSDTGGDPEVLTKPSGQEDDRDHFWPEFLPDGNAVLFTIVPNGSVEKAKVAVLDLRTGKRTVLIQGGTHAHYVRSGHLVYTAGTELRAVPFNVDRMEVTGSPTPVVPQVATTADGGADFDVSINGTLVYVSSAGAALARTLAWVDRNGREEPIRAPARAYTYPRISPDGTRVALGIRDLEQDIWIWDFARENLSRFTFGPASEWYPLWTPDGRRLIFDSGRSGSQNLYWQAANGAGAVERLTDSPLQSFPTSISPDGRHIVFRINGRTQDIAVVTLGEKPRVDPLIQTELQELNGEISPDGRWLAFESGETGVNEVYVCPFPDVSAGRWQISSGGGSRPVWAKRRGDELFFLAPTGIVMGVRVDATTTWTAGPPTRVFDGQFFLGGGGSTGRTYDISPDGQRFLMIKAGTSEQSSASVVVVQNWLDELKRLVPTK